MKNMKRVFALVLVAVMVLALSATAFAAPDPVPTPGTGTITVNNAGIGETYNVYKVLDASVGANGAIVYPAPVDAATGAPYVPTEFANIFEISPDGVNLQKKTGVSDADLFAALKTWSNGKTPAASPITATTDTVKFTGLPFGYYVVTSTMDGGAVISVTSTKPDAVTFEKNTTIPEPEKKANGTSYSIGQTITYTVTFPGANYMIPEDANGNPDPTHAKIVTKYEAKDTLPEFLSNVTVTGIKIDGEAKTVNDTNFPGVSTFGTTKKFDIPWATGNATDGYTSLYKNGAVVEITYTAKLTDVVNVNANNKNTITITPYAEGTPWEEHWDDDEIVKTYAAALKKTDGTKELAGAKFAFYGLVVAADANNPGVYTVVSYDPTAYNTADGATQDPTKLGTEMEVDANGKLYIIGLAEGVSLKGIETVAPDGYNLYTSEITLTPQIMSVEIIKESGTRYYDEDGNLVAEQTSSSTSKPVNKNLNQLDANAIEIVNQKGTPLPETGGIGTTIFFVVGGLMMAAAVVLLITKKRVGNAK